MFGRNPPQPTNVRLVWADGTEKGVELFYAGRRGGMHRWVVTQQVVLGLENQPVGILIDILPPKTQVELEWRR